jgi:hypothetical protein
MLCVTCVILALTQPTFADDCRIPADPDILGLGVRLGIYLQMASNIYIGIVHPEEAESSFPTTNIFMTGIFVALIHSAVNNGYTAGSMICVLWLVILDLPLLVPVLAMASSNSDLSGKRTQSPDVSRPKKTNRNVICYCYGDCIAMDCLQYL